MKRIKGPAVANIFYTKDTEALKKQIESFAKNNINNYEYQSRAVIVPHAGLIFSGQLAYSGIFQLDKNIKNIFIFAPSHKVGFEGLALSTYDAWETPLGNIEINQEINKELEEKFKAKFFDEGHKLEHSIEVQLPLIQSIFENVKIIPVVIGAQNSNLITEIITKYYDNKDFGFIISSDLSHFLNDKTAQNLDKITAHMIETGDISNLQHEQACGATGIQALVNFANNKEYSLIRIGLFNSSKITKDENRVVGYGAWMLYEGGKNKFIKEYYSDYLLELSRKIIMSKYDKKEVITDHAHVFNEAGASFVTLKKNGSLRGCIGSIIAHQPLINDIVQNALKSAFQDRRFKPVEEDEIKDLTIDISLLSVPVPIKFEDEEDLLNKIVPNKDGIIIRDKEKQAVYLPSVWEELKDKKMFLQTLKLKAGMAADHFSPTFEAYKFETEYIKQIR